MRYPNLKLSEAVAQPNHFLKQAMTTAGIHISLALGIALVGILQPPK